MRHALVCLLLVLFPTAAHAFESFQVPCGARSEVGCVSCHESSDGGAGCVSGTAPCLNAFGEDFRAGGNVWNVALALMDSDGDGVTNGAELGDPEGAWGPGTTRACSCASQPGSEDSVPDDRDLDGDGRCCSGGDPDGDGTCERSGFFADCDDTDPDVYVGAEMLCESSADNNCDGVADHLHPECGCLDDASCDDGDDCTMDRCRSGVCESVFSCTDAGVPECADAFDCDDGVPCTYDVCDNGTCGHVDLCTDAGPPECTEDIDCDDGIECTMDSCSAGSCLHLPSCTGPRDEGGCACRATRSPAPSFAWLAIAIVWWVRRAKR